MTHIIFGPPGTGKTHKLIQKVEEYIKDGVDPAKIGYFTFSKNAAEEAQKRMFKQFKLGYEDLPYFRTLRPDTLRSCLSGTTRRALPCAKAEASPFGCCFLRRSSSMCCGRFSS